MEPAKPRNKHELPKGSGLNPYPYNAGWCLDSFVLMVGTLGAITWFALSRVARLWRRK